MQDQKNNDERLSSHVVNIRKVNNTFEVQNWFKADMTIRQETINWEKQFQ